MSISRYPLLGFMAVLALVFGPAIGFAQIAGSIAVIIPGFKAGFVSIGERREEVYLSLGTPKLGDRTASGHLTEIWRSGPAFGGRRQNGLEELQIYFVPASAGVFIVRQIRLSSPSFQTQNGISVRSTFGEIMAAFPNLRTDNEMTNALNGGRNEKSVEALTDRATGIAFEFKAGVQMDPDEHGYCSAINIFRQGTDPRALTVLSEP